MARRLSLATLDRALAAAGALATKSGKLSAAEKRELRTLVTKAAKTGRQGLAHADRARVAWLIRKAGPEKVRLPGGLDERLKRRKEGEPRAPLRSPTAVDPLDRLEKLGALRSRLTDDQFRSQRERILGDEAIADFDIEDVDPLDRVAKIGNLVETGVLSDQQAADLTARILAAR